MVTQNEILGRIENIQLVLDKIEVRGIPNAQAIAVSYEQCNQLKRQIRDLFEQIQNGSKNEQEDGEIDAGNDTGLS